MTDDEYQRIKDHEKARLRAQKRIRKTMKTLKRDKRVQEVVRSMSDAAGRLLRDSTALIDDLRTEVARKTARLSVALDLSDVSAPPDSDASSRTDGTRPGSVDDDLDDDVEAEDRGARAEALVRQMKAQRRRSTRRTSSEGKTSPANSASENTASGDTGDASDTLPERTIGRMRDATPRDASEE